MGFKKKQAEEEQAALLAQQQAEEASRQAEAAKAAAAAEAKKRCTQIPVGVTLTGNFVAEEDIFVAGKIEGSIECQSLNILSGGKHMGKAQVASLNLSGDMQSEVVCQGTAHITPGGVLVGSIASRILNSEPGATIQGQVKIGAAAAPVAENPVKPETVVTETAPKEAVSATEEPVLSFFGNPSESAEDTESDLKAMGL